MMNLYSYIFLIVGMAQFPTGAVAQEKVAAVVTAPYRRALPNSSLPDLLSKVPQDSPIVTLEVYALTKGVGSELTHLAGNRFAALTELRIWTSCEDIKALDLVGLGKLQLDKLAIFANSATPLLKHMPKMSSVTDLELGTPDAFFGVNDIIGATVIRERFPKIATLRLPQLWISHNAARIKSLAGEIKVIGSDPAERMKSAIADLEAKSVDITITTSPKP